MPVRDIVLMTLFFAGIAATFTRPYVGLCLWIIFTYLSPHHFTWGFAYNFSFVFIAAVVTMAMMVLRNEAHIPKLTTSAYLLIALVIWITLTTVFAYDPNQALDEYTQSIKIIALGVVTMLLVNDRLTFMVVTTCLAACILFYGVKGGIFVLMTGGQHTVFGPPDHFMEANNGLGVALLMMIPIAWFLATEASNRWLRYGWLGSIPLTMLAILGTYSRGAALALGCTIVYWTIASGRNKLGFAMVALAPVALFAIMPDQLIDRLETIQNYEQDPSAMSRIEMWRFGFKVALSNPVFGGGFDVFPMYHLYDNFNVDLEFISSGKSAHSIYFEVLGQHGFIGFILFMLMGLTFFFFCGRVKRTYSSATVRNFAAAVQISLVGYAAGGAFVNKALLWPITFQLLGLMTAAATIFAHGQAETGQSAATPASGEGQTKARPGVGRAKPGGRGAHARRMGN